MSESGCQMKFRHKKGGEIALQISFLLAVMVSCRGSTDGNLDNSVAHNFNQIGNKEANELMCYPILQSGRHFGSVGTWSSGFTSLLYLNG